MKFKNLFGSKTNTGNDEPDQSTSKQPLSQPALTPGLYGSFPNEFGIYFIGRSDDKKSDFYFLGQDGPTPLHALVVHKGMVKHQITLYSQPNRNSPPLALGGTEKFFSSQSILALPPSPGSESINRIERLKDHKSIRAEHYSFSLAVGTSTGQRTETFEWRGDDVTKKTNQPLQRRLMRLRGDNTNETEVVGVWTDEENPEKESKLGAFRFQGSAITGELGDYWTLMAVVSLIRLCQGTWEAKVAVDGMLKAAEKLLSAGVGMGINAA